MKIQTASPIIALLASAAALSGQALFESYDFVRTQVSFNTVPAFAPDNPIDIEATGNTISAANFASRVAAAHAGGYGGVISFENGTVLNTGSDTNISNVTWTGTESVLRTNLRAQNLLAQLGNGSFVSIGRGPQWHIEAGGSDNLATAAGPGTPSAGDNNIGGEWFFEFGQNPPQRLPTSGTNVLQGATSWDMSFDPLDQIVVVGLAYLGRDNFQWYGQGGGTPTLYSKATFSDGSTLMSEVGLLQQPAGDYDVFVGFEAPDGLLITGLHLWHRGVNNRGFGSIDDIGIIAIPEPRAYALLFAGLAALLVIRMRRRA